MCGHKLQPIFFRRRRRIASHGNETLALLPASRCVFVHSDDGDDDDDNLEAVVVGRERLPARTSPPKTVRSHSIPKMLFPRSNSADERTNERTDHSLGSEEKRRAREEDSDDARHRCPSVSSSSSSFQGRRKRPGGREACGRRIRECLGAISINGVAEVHFGVCKWQINPRREGGREGREGALEAALRIHARPLLACLPSKFPSLVSISISCEGDPQSKDQHCLHINQRCIFPATRDSRTFYPRNKFSSHPGDAALWQNQLWRR